MDQSTFWGLIDSARNKAAGDTEEMAEILVNTLGGRSVEDIIAFEKLLDQYSRKAYDARLFAAASILDEMSDDDFDYFRFWLISRGEQAFLECVKNPEALAEVAEPDEPVTAEEIGSVPSRAYERKTGKSDFASKFSPAPYPPMKNSSLVWRTSEGYADPARLRELFPALWDRFRDDSDE